MATNIIFPHLKGDQIPKQISPNLNSKTGTKLTKESYQEKSAPFIWIWNVEISKNGYADVYLKEKAKPGAGNYTDEIKILSLTKQEIQELIDQNIFHNKFERVNYEGWLARKTDEMIEELRNVTTDLYEKRKKRITGLIAGDGINPIYKNHVEAIARLKILSVIYKKSIDSNPGFDFHLD